MRIVAGQFRRRQLLVNPGETTRPITDRAKVMLFDRLGNFLRGRRVGDFFAGTGSIGLEALSRGAERVVLAEQDHRAFELLCENVETLGVTDRALCWRINALRSSYKPKGDPAWFPYGVVFFDPPYSLSRTIRPGDSLFEAFRRLSDSSITEQDALLIVRTSRDANVHYPESWTIADQIEVASMRIDLLQKSALENNDLAPSEVAQ